MENMCAPAVARTGYSGRCCQSAAAAAAAMTQILAEYFESSGTAEPGSMDLPALRRDLPALACERRSVSVSEKSDGQISQSDSSQAPWHQTAPPGRMGQHSATAQPAAEDMILDVDCTTD